MAQSNLPPGWSLITVGGTRRAVNPEGENVSRRALLDVQAQMSGFKSYYDYSKHAKRISGFRTKENAKDTALGSPLLRELKEVIIDRGKVKYTQEERRPGGRLATLLEDLGLRPKGADWPVGDSPKGD